MVLPFLTIIELTIFFCNIDVEDDDEPIETPRPSSRGSRASRLGSAVINPTVAAAKRKNDIKEYLEEHALELLSFFNSRNLEAIIRVTRTTLDAIKRRVAASSGVTYVERAVGMKEEVVTNTAAFRSNVVLAIPSITMQPALDEIQQAINKAATMVVYVSKGISQWDQTCKVLDKDKDKDVVKDQNLRLKEAEVDTHSQRSRATSFNSVQEDGASDAGMPSRGKVSHREHSVMIIPPPTTTAQKKSYFKNVAENKEVAKLLSLIQTIVNSQKKAVTTALEQFSKYQHIWKNDKDEKMKEFLDENPNLGEFEVQILSLKATEEIVQQEPETYNVGAIALFTGMPFLRFFFYFHHSNSLTMLFFCLEEHSLQYYRKQSRPRSNNMINPSHL